VRPAVEDEEGREYFAMPELIGLLDRRDLIYAGRLMGKSATNKKPSNAELTGREAFYQ
jgi:hypothetical protein